MLTMMDYDDWVLCSKVRSLSLLSDIELGESECESLCRGLLAGSLSALEGLILGNFAIPSHHELYKILSALEQGSCPSLRHLVVGRVSNSDSEGGTWLDYYGVKSIARMMDSGFCKGL